MYSFNNLSSSLGSISSALALPVSRGRHGKLVDNFSHESDVTSLQDSFTSRPYKTPFYFYSGYCVPRKIRRGILFQIHVEYSPSSRLLVSALAVYATAFRPMFPYTRDTQTHTETHPLYEQSGSQLDTSGIRRQRTRLWNERKR